MGVGIPPTPAPSETLPSSKGKISTPNPLAPKMIPMPDFYAPQKLSIPPTFVYYDGRKFMWYRDTDVLKLPIPKGFGVSISERQMIGKNGEAVFEKNGSPVYEVLVVPGSYVPPVSPLDFLNPIRLFQKIF